MSVTTWPQTIWLVRHAESRGNVADQRARERGASMLDLDVRDPDVDLSPTGERQAAALGRWLADLPAAARPTAVLSSPYRRAAATAGCALARSRLDLPLRHDERLRERDLGMLDGLTGQGIRERYPEEAERRSRLGKLYYRPPSGESWSDVALRVRSMVDSLRAEHAGERLLVVTHQAVIMLFRYVLERLPEDELLAIDRRVQVANAAVTHYAVTPGGGPQLRSFNDTAHLEDVDEPVPDESAADALAR